MSFRLTVEHDVTLEEAVASADAIELAVGEIGNGRRKPGSVPMQDLCSVVQFVRDVAGARVGAQYELVSRARNLVAEAMDQHIYNEADGEEPEDDCQYAQFLRDADTFLAPAADRKVLMVILSSVGNPDHGQDPNSSVPGVPRRIVPVPSLEAAVKCCSDYIDAHDLGGGNWSGGDVFDRTGNVVARVSYNGRCWDPSGREIQFKARKTASAGLGM